jgi:phosphate transport system substrate-binding protein
MNKQIIRRFTCMNPFRRLFPAGVQLRTILLAGLVAIAALSLALAACGDDDEDTGDDDGATTAPASTTAPAGETTAPADGGIDYGELSGEIDIDGSSTVYPISAAMAEEFDAVSDVLVNVAFSGTGGGFEKFCAGEIQVSDASRPISDSDDPADLGEVQICAENGIEDIVELQVGIDALTVMVNPDNDFVTCLTVEQLHNIFKTDGFTNWNEVDPSFPDEDITWYYPGTDSGTFDYFVEAIIEGVDETATHRGDGFPSEDDNILADGIAGDEHSIGYFGFAYFQGAGADLKAVEIDNGDGCVAPSFESALDGTYAPLSRPLFIYTREEFLADHPNSPVLGFIKFYLDNTATIVEEVGYVTLPDDVLATQLAKIEPFLP